MNGLHEGRSNSNESPTGRRQPRSYLRSRKNTNHGPPHGRTGSLDELPGGRELHKSWFTIKHMAGKDIGFTDLISRIPSGKALPISHYDEEFVVAKINKINKSLNPSENPSETRTYVTTDDDQMGQIYLVEEELKVKRVSFVETSFKIWILQEQLWKF